MIVHLSRLALAVLVVSSTATASLAQQGLPTHSRVVDEPGLFKKAAVEAANKALEASEREFRVPVVIEVVEGLKGRSIEDVGLEAARLSGGQGVFVLIAKDEKKLKVFTRRQFEHRFPEDRREAIVKAFLAGFKTGDFDEGLKKGVEAIVALVKETAPAEPPPSPLIARDQVRLTLAGAKKALAAAEAKAAEMKINANIAIVDDGGHLLAFARMDGARPASAATAQTKATSAATMRQATGPLSTEPILNLGLASAAAAGGAKITPLLGGVPIVVDGQVIGAVGVGGGTGEQDATIAKAGAAAVTDEVGAKPGAR
jgi:uncharacterized protein GlcG (DUF336 family)